MARLAISVREARHIEEIAEQLPQHARTTLCLVGGESLTGWLWGRQVSLDVFGGEVFGGVGMIEDSGNVRTVDLLDVVKVSAPATPDPSDEERDRLLMENGDKVPAIVPEAPAWALRATVGNPIYGQLPAGTRIVVPRLIDEKGNTLDSLPCERVIYLEEAPVAAGA